MKVDTKEVRQNLERMRNKVWDNMAEAVGRTGTVAQAEAKRGAPWTDRTGNARASIQATGPVISPSLVQMFLCIGVFYGKYLELSHGGKYRIIWPTIESVRPDFVRNIKNALSI